MTSQTRVQMQSVGVHCTNISPHLQALGTLLQQAQHSLLAYLSCRFLVHRRSGHVVSEKAMKEVPAVVEELIGSAWSLEDWILVSRRRTRVARKWV